MNAPLDPSPDTAPLLQLDARHAVITLRRPARHNCIEPDDVAVIGRLLDEVERTPSIRALVITGSGDRTFCSGYSLPAIRTHLDHGFEPLLERIEFLNLPTICALNGSVFGGGMDLALCCDFRIGLSSSTMRMPAATFGLHFYPGGLRRFVTRLGPNATKKIFLTSQPIQSEEMLRMGFLTECVDAGYLASTVERYVRALADGGSSAIRSMKQHIDRIARGAWTEAEGRAAFLESLNSAELIERLARLMRT